VTNSTGSSPTSSADQFTYINPPPIVTGLSSASGLVSGGTSLTITGSQFIGATSVTFGAVVASSFTVSDDDTIQVLIPAGSAGTVDVRVTTGAGTSATSNLDQYTYQSSSGAGGTSTDGTPQILGLDVNGGSTEGGDVVTIYGLNFTEVTAVKFGSVNSVSFQI